MESSHRIRSPQESRGMLDVVYLLLKVCVELQMACLWLHTLCCFKSRACASHCCRLTASLSRCQAMRAPGDRERVGTRVERVGRAMDSVPKEESQRALTGAKCTQCTAHLCYSSCTTKTVNATDLMNKSNKGRINHEAFAQKHHECILSLS